MYDKDNMKHFGESKWQLSILFAICVVIAFSYLSLQSIFASTNKQIPEMYSTDSSPFNKTYGYWLAEYYKWDIGSPLDENPTFNYDKFGCSPGQKDEVLFLADILLGEEVRTCIIPSDKAILLPTLSGIVWTDKRDVPLASDQVINDLVTEANDVGTIEATLDGHILFSGNTQTLQNFRAESPFFNVTVPDNDIYSPRSVSGEWRAQVDGYFVFLKPLTPGNYTLYTSVYVPEELPNRQSSELTYKLDVRPNYTLPDDSVVK